MKTLFIESKYTGIINLDDKTFHKLPKRIGLVSAVQFSCHIKDIKKRLKGKIVIIPKGNQKYPSQILGCDAGAAVEIKDKVDAFLYIGSGLFHPMWVAEKTGRRVFSFNPLTSSFSEIKKDEIESFKKRKKGALIRFLLSNRIGIIISTKPGQSNFNKAARLKEKLERKECYFFACDTLNLSELENFPFIECWVNTACPRIEGNGIVNLEDIGQQ